MPTLRQPGVLLRLAETWVRRPASPTRLVLSVTRRCNLRCSMCRTWELPRAGELSPDEIGALVAAMPRLTWLDVTGGEPLLRRDADAIFSAILDAAPALRVLHFPTNGWFGDRAVALCERIRRQRPGVELIVTVSLDGPPAVHDRIRGVDGAFDRALDTFVRLRAVPGMDAFVGTTLGPESAGHLDALEALLHERVPGFEPRLWHWNWLQVSEHFFNNDDPKLTEWRGDEALLAAQIRRRGVPRSLVDVMELAFLVHLGHVRRGGELRMSCQALRSACFVSPEGDVYPCHVWDRPLGNVRERPFGDIWAAPETLAARDDAVALRCGGCFTPCEAYPTLAGSPVRAAALTVARGVALAARGGRP